MDSVTLDWFWFWFSLLLVVLDLVVILRALAASSFGVRTFRDHHISTKTGVSVRTIQEIYVL